MRSENGSDEMNAPPVCQLKTLVEGNTTPSLKNQLPAVMFNQPVLAAILSAAVAGTGGFANAQAVALQTFTGATPRAFSIHIGRDDEEGILNTQEKLAGIRRYLSLNATELAKVLNVGRPTVYSWATAPVAMHSKHRERIEAIYQLGRQWRALSSDPMGNSVREPLSNGRTMVD